MSGDRTQYLVLLFSSAFLAVLSAAFLLRSLEEGGRLAAWLWGAYFAVASLVAAWTFWELL